jgi:hypothetical protein
VRNIVDNWQLVVGKEEEKKISLRFPQTFEATAMFSFHINRKIVLLAGWFR